MQHLEETGAAALELSFDDGPLFAAESDLYLRATSAMSSRFPLTFLVHHFDGAACAAGTVGELGFGQIVDAAAQVDRIACLRPPVLQTSGWARIDVVCASRDLIP